MFKVFRWLRKRSKPTLAGLAVLILLVSFASGVLVGDTRVRDNFVNVLEDFVVSIGPETAYAAVPPDYTCDGVEDDEQFQAALDALPTSGGTISFLPGTYTFTATVNRAINSVVWEGAGKSSLINYSGSTAVISAGSQSDWVFRDFSTDAGGINVASASTWTKANLYEGTAYVAYQTSSDIDGSEWDIPSGRGATFTVAASNASDNFKAQADYLCDGTNDHSEINAAFTALPVAGGSVVMSGGTFTINGEVSPSVGATWSGQGWSTVIEAANSYSGFMVHVDTVDDVAIRDLTLDGNRANRVEQFGEDTLRIDNSNRCRVHNVKFDTSPWVAMGYNGGLDGEIRNCYVYNTRSDGLFSSSVERLEITNNHFVTIGDTAVAVSTGSTDCNISENVADTCTSQAFAIMGSRHTVAQNTVNGAYHGIIVGWADSAATDVIVSNNNIYDVTNRGIEVRHTSSTRILIEGNLIKDIGVAGRGINVDGSETSIIGNTITGTLPDTPMVYMNSSGTISNNTITEGKQCIWAQGGDIIITGNNLTSTSTDGGSTCILVYSGSNFVVDANRCSGSSVNQISVQNATHSVVTNNICEGTGTYSIREIGSSNYNTITDNYTKGIPWLYGTHNSFDLELMSITLDLSVAGTDMEVWHATMSCNLIGYRVLYTETSSANAGVSIDVGRYQNGVALDDDYFDTTTSEASKSMGYAKWIDVANLTNTVIAAGDTITVGTAGGKVGTGEVQLILQIMKSSEQ